MKRTFLVNGEDPNTAMFEVPMWDLAAELASAH
jgi:hypothetical protein